MTTNIGLADSWEAKDTALSVLKNSVSFAWRKSLYVAEASAKLQKQKVADKKAEAAPLKKAAECKGKTEPPQKQVYDLPKYSFKDDDDIQAMIRGFEDVRDVLRTYGSRKSYDKINEHSIKADFVMEDIKHYHARKALNSRDGFKLNKLEDRAVVKRISIRNQLKMSEAIVKCCNEILPKIDEICNTIEQLRSQKYTPRVLMDLYENNNLDEDIDSYI